MVDKVRLGMGITGPYLPLANLPQAAAAKKALTQDVYAFDVPNAALDGTVTQSLTLAEAVQEVFAAAERLAAKG